MSGSLVVKRLPWMAEDNLRVHQILGEPKELTAEILRLFVLHSHNDKLIQATGVDKEDYASYQFASFWEPGGALFVAQSKRRLVGLIYIVPQLWPSSIFDRHIWSVQHLIIAPDAPAETAESLINAAFALNEAPMEFVTTSVPATDWTAISGLQKSGFRTVCGEALGVIRRNEISALSAKTVSIKPMEKRFLPAVAAIASARQYTGQYADNPNFNQSKAGKLHVKLLVSSLKDSLAEALVAENGLGKVMGFIKYRRDTRLEEHTKRQLAIIDSVGVAENMRSSGMAEFLYRKTINVLKDQGVDAITVKTTMSDKQSTKTLSMLGKIGFQIVASNLVMHRSLN